MLSNTLMNLNMTSAQALLMLLLLCGGGQNWRVHVRVGVGVVHAHSSLISRMPRNAVDRALPPWSGGRFGNNYTCPPDQLPGQQHHQPQVWAVLGMHLHQRYTAVRRGADARSLLARLQHRLQDMRRRRVQPKLP